MRGGTHNWDHLKRMERLRNPPAPMRLHDEPTKTVRCNYDDVICTNCYTPIQKGIFMNMTLKQGDRAYQHVGLCPSLSERRRMRMEVSRGV